MIEGAPGIGKTRLVEEFINLIQKPSGPAASPTLVIQGTNGNDSINQTGNTVTVNNGAVIDFSAGAYNELDINALAGAGSRPWGRLRTWSSAPRRGGGAEPSQGARRGPEGPPHRRSRTAFSETKPND